MWLAVGEVISRPNLGYHFLRFISIVIFSFQYIIAKLQCDCIEEIFNDAVSISISEWRNEKMNTQFFEHYLKSHHGENFIHRNDDIWGVSDLHFA